MAEYNFGSLSKRQLCIRVYSPHYFKRYTPAGFRLSPLRLLNPLNWWQALRRGNWDFWYRRFNEVTHRCYCPDGWLFDGRVCIAGFGVTWFYSHYTGEVPCVCDKVMDEMFPINQHDALLKESKP